MPSLDFKGKSFIYTHHLGVPYRELLVVPEKSCPADGRAPDLDDNLILHGDNLEALKALLPRYAGKVDCIYIDPPYNTGTEGWCYNDAVNAPLMREWLKKSANPVEREDLQRHDKWLCMMWPRLQLLKELLAEDGAIFVSIDDNEVHRLRDLMDEVFGEENFVANIIWHKSDSPKNTAQYFSVDHDYVMVFAKFLPAWVPNLVPRSAEMLARYKNPDNDPRGPWMLSDLDARNFYSKGSYSIKCPSGRTVPGPPSGRYWTVSEEKFWALDADKRIWWGEDGKSPPNVKRFLNEVKDGVVPQTIWAWEEVGSTRHSKSEVVQIMHGTVAPVTDVSVPVEQEGDVFITPKPTRLLERILKIATNKESIILDSFAGSGTTGHAVLALNAKDGGKRRFILVQCDEYNRETKESADLCNILTAERVRRVIRGYDYTGTAETELHPPEKVTWTTFSKDKNRNEILERIEGIETLERANYDRIEKKITDGALTIVGQKQVKKKMPGLGGSFTYLELGEAMDLERLLAETPGTLPTFPALARYLFFTATGHTLAERHGLDGPDGQAKRGKAKPEPTDEPVLIGETAVWRIHLHYRPDEAWLRSPAAAFTRTHAEAIAEANKGSGKQALVFAAAKFINHRSLRELKVDFAQLPYALHRVQAE
ncbi:MAG: site-specific DNA-methyltransferase [Verrucomicrobiae bacterium]